MLMHALWEHDNGRTIGEVRTWGIDQLDPSHAQQRAAWAWWTGQAAMRGIELTGTSLAYQDEQDHDKGLQWLHDAARMTQTTR
jgi:hypothetical protein